MYHSGILKRSDPLVSTLIALTQLIEIHFSELSAFIFFSRCSVRISGIKSRLHTIDSSYRVFMQDKNHVGLLLIEY